MRQYSMKRAGHISVCSVSYQHCNVYEPKRKNWKVMYQNISNAYIGVVELFYFFLVPVCLNDLQ